MNIELCITVGKWNKTTFNLVTALHVSYVNLIGIATSLRGKSSGARISIVVSRPAMGAQQTSSSTGNFPWKKRPGIEFDLLTAI